MINKSYYNMIHDLKIENIETIEPIEEIEGSEDGWPQVGDALAGSSVGHGDANPKSNVSRGVPNHSVGFTMDSTTFK